MEKKSNVSASTTNPNSVLENPKTASLAPINIATPPRNVRVAVMLNQREFSVLSGHEIFKYSSDDDNWTLLLTLPSKYDLSDVSMVVDGDLKQLYVTTQQGAMTVIDIQNESVIHRSLLSGKCGNNNSNGAMVNVNGDIHKIKVVASCHLHHEVWNKTRLEWDQIEQNESVTAFQTYLTDQLGDINAHAGYAARSSLGSFEPYEIIDFGETSVSLIYVLSLNIILMFCAMQWFGEYDDFGESYPLGVWKYSIETAQWEQVSYDYDFKGCSFVLTEDEKHVIIIGKPLYGGEKYAVENIQKASPTIHILHIADGKEWTMSCCPIAFPTVPLVATRSKKGDYRSLLFSGWIRREFTANEFIGVTSLPVDIKKMIGEYCTVEMIH